MAHIAVYTNGGAQGPAGAAGATGPAGATGATGPAGSVTFPITVPQGGTGLTLLATGDILYATNASTMVRLPVGSNGQILQVNPATGLLAYSDFYNISRMVYIVDDFIMYASAGNLVGDNCFPTASTAGTVAPNTAQTGANPGVMALPAIASGTYSYIVSSANSDNLITNGGAVYFETIVGADALSDGTNTYTVTYGLMSGNTTGTPSYGIYFQYTNGVNSGKWVCNTAMSSVVTAINTNSTVTTAFTRLGFILNSAGTSVEFFINGVSQGTTVTNLPAGNVMRLEWLILKSAGIGTVNGLVDAVKYIQVLGVAR